MVSGSLSQLNRYRNKSEEEKEALRIQMSENYYKRTEGKVKRRKQPLKFTKNPEFKNRKLKELSKWPINKK